VRSALYDSARSRHRVWVTAYSVLVGQLTHIALDAFTHSDGWVVRNVPLFRTSWFMAFGHHVALYNVLQYGLSVALGVWCLVMLDRWWSTPRPMRDEALPTLRPAGTGLVAGGCFLGVVVASVTAPNRYGWHDFHGRPFFTTGSTTLITWCWIAFAGLLVGSLLARPFVTEHRLAHQPRSTHS
jgi:hypothetical protein